MVRRKVDQDCVGGPCRSGENCGGQNHSSRHREHQLRHARPSMDQELIWLVALGILPSHDPAQLDGPSERLQRARSNGDDGGELESFFSFTWFFSENHRFTFELFHGL